MSTHNTTTVPQSFTTQDLTKDDASKTGRRRPGNRTPPPLIGPAYWQSIYVLHVCHSFVFNFCFKEVGCAPTTECPRRVFCPIKSRTTRNACLALVQVVHMFFKGVFLGYIHGYQTWLCWPYLGTYPGIQYTRVRTRVDTLLNAPFLGI